MKNKKKTVKIFLAVILGVMIISGIVLVLATMLQPKIGFTEKQDDIFYFPENYSENIFEDIVYLDKQRDVNFDNYGLSVLVTEENYHSMGTEAKFFYDYFQAVINGECEKHKEFYHKSFFKRHYIPDKFTKQKIYDIEVSALTSDVENGVAYETFKVSYKIYENNGTFRADVSSGESKPLAFKVMKGKEIKIVSVVPIL